MASKAQCSTLSRESVFLEWSGIRLNIRRKGRTYDVVFNILVRIQSTMTSALSARRREEDAQAFLAISSFVGPPGIGGSEVDLSA